MRPYIEFWLPQQQNGPVFLQFNYLLCKPTSIKIHNKRNMA